MDDIKTINKEITNIKSNLLEILKKKYKLIEKEYNEDRDNYYKIDEYKKINNYINDFLKLEKLNKNYFYKNSFLIPTDGEMTDINKIVDKLWILDKNKFIFGIDLKLNLQKKIEYESNKDEAPYALFRYVNIHKFDEPTYKSFIEISNFYTKELGVSEISTSYKREKLHKFIKSLLETDLFIYLYYFLLKKNIIKKYVEFQSYIYDLWFKYYSRGGKNDSSPFEHIFIGETTKDKTIGFHNWIHFFMEERLGKVDYYGYMNVTNINYPYVLNLKFKWEGKIKGQSSGFIGTSPEFEMVLYTICSILIPPDKKYISFDLQNNKIKLLLLKREGRIYASYPMLLDRS